MRRAEPSTTVHLDGPNPEWAEADEWVDADERAEADERRRAAGCMRRTGCRWRTRCVRRAAMHTGGDACKWADGLTVGHMEMPSGCGHGRGGPDRHLPCKQACPDGINSAILHTYKFSTRAIPKDTTQR
ncbi:hypothetical protein ACLOJK_026477 [Asimina triloba]